ncbi:MAG: class II aldolase/adducin family protein [Rhodothermales bacterium]
MDQEGVIKFELWFIQTPPLPDEALHEINAWRKILRLTRLIGRDPQRYGGLGYGNISRRVAPFDAPPHERHFLISGSQTGGLPDLTGAHYALVRAFHPDQNLVAAEGPILPSSESLTHGKLYALDNDLRFVMHVHSPPIWHHAHILDIPTTRPDVPYGSPEMSAEVCRLYRETDVRERQIFVMGGHEDGLVSFGRTAEEAGTVLLTYLARALQL